MKRAWSEGRKGKVTLDPVVELERRRKISVANRGKVMSPMTRAKLSAKAKARWAGKTFAPKVQERKHRDRRFRRKYGITVEQYDAMVRSQNGLCALCGRPPKRIALAIDHNHATKRVRGLLCYGCNVNLGHLENYIGLQRLMSYLEERDF